MANAETTLLEGDAPVTATETPSDSQESATDQLENLLKYAPICGPIIVSPQQYVPTGYALLECVRCGGVDGMQMDIKICVYCADKRDEALGSDDAIANHDS